MRLQVNVSDEMVSRIDRIAGLMGVPRSSLCAVLIGQGIMSYEKGLDTISEVGMKLISAMEEEDAPAHGK